MVFLNKLVILCCAIAFTYSEEITTIQQQRLHREVEQLATSSTFVNSGDEPSEEIEPPKLESESTHNYENFYSPQLSGKLQPPLAAPTISTFFNPSDNYEKFTPDYSKGALKTLYQEQPEYFAENYSPLKLEEKSKINNLNFNLPPIPSDNLQLPHLTPYNPNNDPRLLFSENLEDFDLSPKKKTPTQLYPKKYNPTFNKKLKVYPVDNKVNYLKVPLQRSDKFSNIPTYVSDHSGNDGANIKKYNQKPYEKYGYKPTNSEFSINKFEKNNAPSFDSDINEKESIKGFDEPIEKAVERISSVDGDDIENSFKSEQFSHNIELPSQKGDFFTESAGLHQGNHNGDRLEFHMHGHKGPDSYKFGFDTGKGHDRQFRYEERDKDGYVTGHYGFYDKHGKLRVINYDADPHGGFRAHPQL